MPKKISQSQFGFDSSISSAGSTSSLPESVNQSGKIDISESKEMYSRILKKNYAGMLKNVKKLDQLEEVLNNLPKIEKSGGLFKKNRDITESVKDLIRLGFMSSCENANKDALTTLSNKINYGDMFKNVKEAYELMKTATKKLYKVNKERTIIGSPQDFQKSSVNEASHKEIFKIIQDKIDDLKKAENKGNHQNALDNMQSTLPKLLEKLKGASEEIKNKTKALFENYYKKDAIFVTIPIQDALSEFVESSYLNTNQPKVEEEPLSKSAQPQAPKKVKSELTSEGKWNDDKTIPASTVYKNDKKQVIVTGQEVNLTKPMGRISTLSTKDFQDLLAKQLDGYEKDSQGLFIDVDSGNDYSSFKEKFTKAGLTLVKEKKYYYQYQDEAGEDKDGEYKLFKFQDKKGNFVSAIKVNGIEDNKELSKQWTALSNNLNQRHISNDKYKTVVYNCSQGRSRSLSLAVMTALRFESEKLGRKLNGDEALKIMANVITARNTDIRNEYEKHNDGNALGGIESAGDATIENGALKFSTRLKKGDLTPFIQDFGGYEVGSEKTGMHKLANLTLDVIGEMLADKSFVKGLKSVTEENVKEIAKKLTGSQNQILASKELAKAFYKDFKAKFENGKIDQKIINNIKNSNIKEIEDLIQMQPSLMNKLTSTIEGMNEFVHLFEKLQRLVSKENVVANNEATNNQTSMGKSNSMLSLKDMQHSSSQSSITTSADANAGGYAVKEFLTKYNLTDAVKKDAQLLCNRNDSFFPKSSADLPNFITSARNNNWKERDIATVCLNFCRVSEHNNHGVLKKDLKGIFEEAKSTLAKEMNLGKGNAR